MFASVLLRVHESVAASPFVRLVGDGFAASVKTVNASMQLLSTADKLGRLVRVAAAATVVPVQQISVTYKIVK